MSIYVLLTFSSVLFILVEMLLAN